MYNNNGPKFFKEPQGVTYDLQKNLNVIVLKTFPKYFVVIFYFKNSFI